MKFLGDIFDTGADPQASGDDIPIIIQQDGTDPGRKIYVQFTGDSNPSSPVKGDIRIKET